MSFALRALKRIDLLVDAHCAPERCLGLDRYLLDLAQEGGARDTATLRVFSVPTELISVGRYHCVPRSKTHAGPQFYRRLSGGRVVPFGEGFLGISLVLPHRSAMDSDDPRALRPTQVLNRCVRGILQALRGLNLAVFYPGRDCLTIDGRALAALSFEVQSSGSLLFEAVLAHRCDFAVLPQRLDAADPTGAITAAIVSAEQVTSLEREVGAEFVLEELAEVLRRGYESAAGIECVRRTLTPTEEDRVAATTRSLMSGETWLQSRLVPPELDHHSIEPTQLGFLEAHFSVGVDGHLGTVLLAGDFLANSSAIDIVQRRLRGCPLKARVIDAVVEDVFNSGDNFILGIGQPRTITHAILKAVCS